MNLFGKKFGRLVVTGSKGKDKYRNLLWLCKCKCGNETIQRTNTLRMGLVKSCGCYLREAARRRMIGNRNPMWKKNPSLGALHTWLRVRKPKIDLCEICGERIPQDLANVSGEYTRKVKDYKWLCRKCHMESDGRINRRKVNGQFERTIKYPFGINESLQ